MTYEDINSLSAEKRMNDERLWTLWQQVACWLWKQETTQTGSIGFRCQGFTSSLGAPTR